MEDKEEKIVSLTDARKKDKQKMQSNTEEEVQMKESIYCSFCGRPNTEVIKMVKGPGVNICSECAMIALQYLILDDRIPSGEAQQILDIFWSKAK